MTGFFRCAETKLLIKSDNCMRLRVIKLHNFVADLSVRVENLRKPSPICHRRPIPNVSCLAIRVFR